MDGPLNGTGPSHRITGSPEDGKEAVALSTRRQHAAAMLCNAFDQKLIVTINGTPHCAPVLLPETGRSFDVREQERHHPSRHLSRRGPATNQGRVRSLGHISWHAPRRQDTRQGAGCHPRVEAFPSGTSPRSWPNGL